MIFFWGGGATSRKCMKCGAVKGHYFDEQQNNIFFSYVLLTVHLGSVLVNSQLDAQFFLSYIFIPILYMFRAPLCSLSGESIVIIRHLVYVVHVGDRQVCKPAHLTVTYMVDINQMY